MLTRIHSRNDVENILNEKEDIKNNLKSLIDLDKVEDAYPDLFPFMVKDIKKEIEAGNWAPIL